MIRNQLRVYAPSICRGIDLDVRMPVNDSNVTVSLCCGLTAGVAARGRAARIGANVNTDMFLYQYYDILEILRRQCAFCNDLNRRGNGLTTRPGSTPRNTHSVHRNALCD